MSKWIATDIHYSYSEKSPKVDIANVMEIDKSIQKATQWVSTSMIFTLNISQSVIYEIKPSSSQNFLVLKCRFLGTA